MPRARSPDSIEAEKLFHSGMKLIEIAEVLEVPAGTVRRWKSTQNWAEVERNKNERSEKQKKANVRKRGAPLGNKNAAGNSGGAPVGNHNSVKHGFFRKIFPEDEDTLEIINAIMEKEPEDIIWENIVIQYTAIVRAQKLMYVKNQDDTTKVLKRMKKGSQGKELEFELQFAWDKQASFLQAQSKAMQALISLIKQFREIVAPDDERLLRLESMQLDIDKKRKEIGESGKNDDVVRLWVKKVQAERVKSDGK